MSKFNELAAKHIDSLHSKINELNIKIDTLDKEIMESTNAHHYMMALIEVIKTNPGLLTGWQYFLSAAKIEEPHWKHEYENEFL